MSPVDLSIRRGLQRDIAIYAELRERGPASVQMLVRALGKSEQAIRDGIKRLQADGKVEAWRRYHGRPGLPHGGTGNVWRALEPVVRLPVERAHLPAVHCRAPRSPDREVDPGVVHAVVPLEQQLAEAEGWVLP